MIMNNHNNKFYTYYFSYYKNTLDEELYLKNNYYFLTYIYTMKSI